MEYFTRRLPKSVSCFALQLQSCILGSSISCCVFFFTSILYYSTLLLFRTCLTLVWQHRKKPKPNRIETLHFRCYVCVCVCVCVLCVIGDFPGWAERSWHTSLRNLGTETIFTSNSNRIKLNQPPLIVIILLWSSPGGEKEGKLLCHDYTHLCSLLWMGVCACTSYFYYMWVQRDNISQFFPRIGWEDFQFYGE